MYHQLHIKKVLEETAHRYMGITTPNQALLIVDNLPAEETAHTVPLLPSKPDSGTRVCRRFNQVFIDQADAALFKVGEELTLLRWGNMTITSIEIR